MRAKLSECVCNYRILYLLIFDCVGKPFLSLLVIISCFPVISAINLSQCKNNILQEWTTWNSSDNTSPSNTTLYPTPTWAHCSLDPFSVVNNSTQNVTLTYNQCKCKCGTGPGDFTWTKFSQNFSTWLLPWLALMFQLPFGSEGKLSYHFCISANDEHIQ
jgi:hypothetical protein